MHHSLHGFWAYRHTVTTFIHFRHPIANLDQPPIRTIITLPSTLLLLLLFYLLSQRVEGITLPLPKRYESRWLHIFLLNVRAPAAVYVLILLVVDWYA